MTEDIETSACECCGMRDHIAGVASIALGPMSILWCRPCIAARAHPKTIIEFVIEECGGIDKISISESVPLIYYDKETGGYVDVRTDKLVIYREQIVHELNKE